MATSRSFAALANRIAAKASGSVSDPGGHQPQYPYAQGRTGTKQSQTLLPAPTGQKHNHATMVPVDVPPMA